MRVLISTGEASGDAYGAALVREMMRLLGSESGSWLFEGAGGVAMRDAGVGLLADSSSWGAIGAFHALGVAPRVLSGARRLRAELETGPTGLFVPIDFGFVNIRLARVAKAKGWKVLYFVPPGSW